MKLPNGERADLGTKLEDYALNSNHRNGQHKARVFESALGITLRNKEVLARALLEAAAYALRFKMMTDKGSATVLCAWIIRRNEDFPRLTTCFIV